MLKLLTLLNDREWKKKELEFNLNQLPQKMIDSILKYKFWEDKQTRILGKLLLKKQLLDFNTGLDLNAIKINPFNKPYVDECFNFSIAHSNQLVACLASDNSIVGLDVEFMKPLNNGYPEELFSSKECDYLLNSKQLTFDFYSLFTRKEALSKAFGEGVFMDFTKHSVLNQSLIIHNLHYYVNTFVFSNQYMISYVTNEPKPLLNIEFINHTLLNKN